MFNGALCCLRLPLCLQDCVKQGQLSSLQLETVLYANMRFNLRLPNGEGAQHAAASC